MEQTALRPKPLPGRPPGDGSAAVPPPARRPHATRRRLRRLRAVLSGLIAGTVLLLSGVGLGILGATAIGPAGLDGIARAGRHAAPAAPSPARPAPPAPSAPGAAPVAAPATLGVEAVDALDAVTRTDAIDGRGDERKTGALVVAVHVPGPAASAGLVTGDVLLALGRNPVGSAADLAAAVARTRPGSRVTLTVRHRNGARQELTVVPGVVT
ncbi:PDZ domain-containing protein [Streptomyces sp. H51]|uniref:PDZ domain-containing protein n=1 Tax=Streptomyces sp. H51 TaxID=3111770 RepID=UPI002D7A071B|nr:PDZ domain-containing protein [Streptomyces sp. H51]